MITYIKFQEKKLKVLRPMVGVMQRMILIGLSIMMRVRIGIQGNKILPHLQMKSL